MNIGGFRAVACLVATAMSILLTLSPEQARAQAPARGPSPAAAEAPSTERGAEDGAGPPKAMRYLLVLDDSSSMRSSDGSADKHDGNDPDRLSILATRLFLELLGPNDEVLVYGMNELASIEGAPARFKNSAAARSDYEARLAARAADHALGSFARAGGKGQGTPCREALAAARGLTSGQDTRKGMNVLFLADGGCDDPLPTEHGLAAKDSWFRFYFLSFMQAGQQSGEQLDKQQQSFPTLQRWMDESFASQGLAKRYGVTAGTDRSHLELVQVFANVLAASRGYAVQSLGTERSSRGYPGADRVTVFSIARGARAGNDLALSYGEAKRAAAYRQFGWEEPGFSGQPYQYAVVTLDGRDPARKELSVAGGQDADFVVLPDYRGLQARVRLAPDCGQSLKWPDQVVLRPTETPCLAFGLAVGSEALGPHDLQLVAARGDFDLVESPSGATGERFSIQLAENPAGDSGWLGERKSLPAVGRYLVTALVSPAGAPPLRGKVFLNATERGLVTTWELSGDCAEQPASRPAPKDATAVDAAAKGGPVIRVGDLEAGDICDVEFTIGTRDLKDGETIGVETLLPGIWKDSEKCFAHSWVKADPSKIEALRETQLFTLRLEGRRCPGDTDVSGVMHFETQGNYTGGMAIPIDANIVGVGLLAYWAPIVAKVLAGLFALVTLLCLIRGFFVPTRGLSSSSSKRVAVRWAASPKYISRSRREFADGAEHYGTMDYYAKKLSRGWYQNAAVGLDCTNVLSGGGKPQFLLEFQPGGLPKLRLVKASSSIELHELRPSSIVGDRDDDALIEITYQKGPTLGRSVGFPCKLYARLFGKMPDVSHAAFEFDTWYRADAGGERLYFNVELAEPE